MNKENIVFCSFPDYSGALKPFYEYLINQYQNINITWIVIEKSMEKKLKQQNINVILYNTQEYFTIMKNAKIIFSDHFNLTKDKSPNSIYVDFWHGIGMKPVGYFLNKLSEDDEKWLDYNKEVVDYLIVPNGFWKYIFSALFNFDSRKILPLGYPKFDSMLNKNCKSDLAKIMKKDITKYSKIIYYLPTFKKGCNREDFNEEISNILDLKKYDEKILFDFLKQNSYLLVVKYHPSEELKIKKVHNDNVYYLTDKELLNNQITINEILNAADLLITDFSSLGVEFEFLDKPVIYLNTKIKDEIKNRGIILENYKFWTNNNDTDNINELLKLTTNLLANFKLDFQRKELFFSNLKNGNCQNIANYFFNKNGVVKNLKNSISQKERLALEISQKSKKIVELEEKIIHNTNEISNLKNQIVQQKDELKKLNEEKANLQYKITSQNKIIEELTNELQNMINSKSWKVTKPMRTIMEKIHRGEK